MKNQVTLTGNLGSDPETVRTTEAGGAVVRFSIAQTERKLNQESGEYEDSHTNWIPIKAFGSLAERATQSLKKGDVVSLSGVLRSSQYEDKGVKRSSYEVIANEILKSEYLAKQNTENPQVRTN